MNGEQIFRVLTFDGGPSGLFTIRVLRHLEARNPGFLEKTQLFCGTSDGAFLALFLAHWLETKRGSGLEAIDACIEFTKVYLPAFEVGPLAVTRFLSGIGPLDYGHRVRKIMESTFGDATLGDLEERLVTVLAFDSTHWVPSTFHAFNPGGQRDLRLSDAALASSSFPGLIPIFRFRGNPTGTGERRDGSRIIDGGLVATNPVMAGLHDALLHLQYSSDLGLAGRPASEILPCLRILSLGGKPSKGEREFKQPGLFGRFIRMLEGAAAGRPRPLHPREHDDAVIDVDGESRNWGWISWFARRPYYLFDLLVYGGINYGDRHANTLLGDNHYRRYEPELELVRTGMDAVLRQRGLLDRVQRKADELAQADELDELSDWVRRAWMPADEAAPRAYEPRAASMP